MNILSAFSVIWRTFAHYRRYIAILVVLGFFGAFLEGIGINAAIPLMSFLISGGAPTDFISRAVEAGFGFVRIPFTFRYLLGFVIGLFILRAVAQVLFGYVRGWISAQFLSTKSKSMLRKTLFASWPFLLRQKLGHVQHTLVREVQHAGSLLEVIGQAIQSFTGFFMYLLIALNISVTVTLSALVAGGGLLFIVRPLVRRIHRSVVEMGETEKQLSHFLSENILGMKVIKAGGAEEVTYSYSQKLFNQLRDLQIRLVLIKSFSTSFFQPFAILFVIVLFSVSYKTPGFSFIAFAASLYLIQKVFVYLESGQNAINSMITLLPYVRSLEQFDNLLVEHQEVADKEGEVFSFEHDIRFDAVSLSYQRAPALVDVSFTIPRGHTVGLIGPSGAGKTTIADLLLRLFEPTAGAILLDGKPLSAVRLNEWRQRIGYVAQDAFLVNDTIEENIRFYYPELSTEDIIAAAKQANIYDFIVGLPEGFKTIVGDRGVMLSGGQRQRIVLARALARRPDLLILDEATSALDAESERLIQEAIRNLSGTVTVFIIAHRLSTIEHADTILVIKEGRICEEGSPAELRKNPHSYFTLQSAVL